MSTFSPRCLREPFEARRLVSQVLTAMGMKSADLVLQSGVSFCVLLVSNFNNGLRLGVDRLEEITLKKCFKHVCTDIFRMRGGGEGGAHVGRDGA